MRTFALLHDARGVLLSLGEPLACDTSPWEDRVSAIDAEYDGEWELPVLGHVAAPAAVLIRPDGYVAWVGEGTEAGLRDALTTCAAVLAAYLVVLGLDPEAVALSPFGPSQAGRFYGVSNLLETMLLVPALIGAARLGRAGVAVAALALVTVAGSRFGADGGGLIVLLAAYGTLLLRTTHARLGAARLVAVAAAAVALGLVLVAVDAALGGSSHVTHAVGGGPGELLGDLGDRLEISARRTFESFGPAFAALASLAVLLFVASRRPRGPLTDAMLVGLLVSLLVNDTPGDVLGIGAVGAFVLWRYERRTPDEEPAWRDRLRAMRRPVIALALSVVALALGVVVAGCSEGEVGATPNTVEGTLPTETTGGSEADLPALELTGDATAGKAVFESAGCTACHTLSAAGSTGTVGPNLDQAQPSFDLVVQRVTLGQGGMPSFQDQLQPQQIADVAEFVSSSAGG